MQEIILLKKSNAVDLAHLYEHLFCAEITNLFYKNNLFQYLDYSLTGKTYHGGVIYIELEFYTKAAFAFAEKIPTLTLRLDETSINKGYNQLTAEEGQPLGTLGYEKVRQALNELHNVPWENIDDLTVIDVKDMRRKSGALYIAEGKPILARRLVTSIRLDPDFARLHRNLVPLFRQLAWLTTVNIQDILCDTRGYFSFDDSYTANSSKAVLSNVFKVAGFKDIHVDVKEDLDVCLRVAKNLLFHGAFDRFVTDLQTTSYTNHANRAPNLEKSYEDTLIFVGAEGWRQIATKENCELLFSHMSIEVKLGRDKISSLLFNKS